MRSKSEIINEIKGICKSVDAEKDFKKTRAQLDLLINELRAIDGTVSNQYPIDKVKGVWKQLWTDQYYPIPSFLKLVPDQIFQIVSENGYYWNASNTRIFNTLTASGFLRGKYKNIYGSPTVEIEFTKNGFRPFKLPTTNLFSFVQNIENGKSFIISTGKNPPNGPIGIKGTLTSLYVDENIRIDLGSQTDYYNVNNQLIVPGFENTLFILEKVK